MRKKIFKIFFWLFGLSGEKQVGENKGTIIILIDGLSFDALTFAIKKRYCPAIKKLSKGPYILSSYYTGLPAATTATEALLFYGNNDNIPGFTWYDRALKKFVRGNRSEELTQFEDIYKKKRSIFKGGSVIMGVYSGGATKLCMSGRNLAFSRSLYLLKTAHYFLVAFLYPIQLIRTVYLTLKTLILFRGFTRSVAKDTLSKIVLGQFSCFLTEIEIMRNTKNIFVDFLLYDEYAHEYGPTNSTTLSALWLVDRYIKRIVHTAKNAERPYELILLSDHGQTESVPFDFSEVHSIQDIKMSLNNISYKVIKTYGSETLSDKNELYVVPAGSTLQLYFSHSLNVGLHESEINTQFPQFIERLLLCKEFGWILVRKNKDSAVLYGKNGSVTFESNNFPRVNGVPFPHIEKGEENKIIASFQNYCTFSNNGDIVLFGNITKQKKVYSFENHKGTHGGFYGPMTHPFIMTSNPSIKGDSMSSLFDTIAVTV